MTQPERRKKSQEELETRLDKQSWLFVVITLWIIINAGFVAVWFSIGMLNYPLCDGPISLSTIVFPGSLVGCGIVDFIFWMNQPLF